MVESVLQYVSSHITSVTSNKGLQLLENTHLLHRLVKNCYMWKKKSLFLSLISKKKFNWKNVKKSFYCILPSISKHQHLSSKCHWKSRGNFIELFTDVAFSFSDKGSKIKTLNWRIFCMFYRKLDFPRFK